MGKHDSDEGLGFFLGGAETIKNIAVWIKNNINIICIIILIPLIGFAAYAGAKFLSNRKNNNNEELTYAVASNISSDDKDNKEYVGGYEVVGEIKISYLGIDVKVLNPIIDGANYTEDCLEHGAVLYYGDGLNELGNTSIIGHNKSSVFFSLKNLEIDDEITVIGKNGNSLTYTVIDIKNVEPDDLSILLPMEENSREITLITCDSEGTTRLAIKAIAK